jgi:ABC-type glutathione transport system ATPase component
MAIEPSSRGSVNAVITTRGMSKRHRQRKLFSRNQFIVDALIDVNLEVVTGRLTALVGESGSGKSTLASCLALIEKPDAGEIWFEGKEISWNSPRKLVELRPRIQMVFQDSAGALNPTFTAAEIIAEPLEIQRLMRPPEIRSRVYELMEEVGLLPEWANRKTSEFSGGQRQRLAIARAIALKPTLLILDESLSGLDLCTQAQIINLLMDLRESYALSLLLISHDLGLVGQVADYVAVMHQGRMVEQGCREEIFATPTHSATQRLLASGYQFDQRARFAHAGASI